MNRANDLKQSNLSHWLSECRVSNISSSKLQFGKSKFEKIWNSGISIGLILSRVRLYDFHLFSSPLNHRLVLIVLEPEYFVLES